MPIERVTQTSIMGIIRKRETVESLPPGHIEKLEKEIPWDSETSSMRTAYRPRLEIQVLDDKSLVVAEISPLGNLVRSLGRTGTLTDEITREHSPSGTILTGEQINQANLSCQKEGATIRIRYKPD